MPSISRRFTSKQLVYKTLADFPASASIGISLAWNPLTDTAVVKNFREVAAQGLAGQAVRADSRSAPR
ncbi:hypothetical protein [Pusillimonas sp. MFBS29]|uniref:hypothetical protein n=1 Tax=Pusillimonas sp. MFBS29 TaxID=2886690 RepID=UPI00351D6702